MAFVRTPITQTIAYSASAQADRELLRDRILTQFDLGYLIQHDNAALVTDQYEDALLKGAGGVKLAGSNGRTYIDVGDLRLLHAWAWIRHGGRLHLDPLTLASGNNAQDRFRLPVHFGNLIADPYDLSVAIPAELLSYLTLSATWPAATVLSATNSTIDTNTAIQVTEYGVQGLRTPTGVAPRFPAPKLTQQAITIDATYSNLGKKVDLPVGSFLRGILVMLLDNTAAPNDSKDDTRITELAIELPKDGNRKLYHMTWRDAKFASKTYAVQPGNTMTAGGSIPGVVWIDCRELVDLAALVAARGDPRSKQFGLDLRRAEAGDVKLSFTIGTGNGVIKILYDQIDV